jgi:hypothetical protein
LLDFAAGTWVDNSEFFTFGADWISDSWASSLVTFTFVLSAAHVFTVLDGLAFFTGFTDWSWSSIASLHDFWWTDFIIIVFWNTFVDSATGILA